MFILFSERTYQAITAEMIRRDNIFKNKYNNENSEKTVVNRHSFCIHVLELAVIETKDSCQHRSNVFVNNVHGNILMSTIIDLTKDIIHCTNRLSYYVHLLVSAIFSKSV